MAEKKTPKLKDFTDFIPEEALQHARAAKKEMQESVEAIFPPGFIEHRRAAGKEMLLFAQEMISHAIDRIEEKDKK